MGEPEIKIVLLPITTYDKHNNAEAYENSVFEKIADARQLFGEEAIIYDLTDFMDDCNNEELSLDEYWLTYITIKNN